MLNIASDGLDVFESWMWFEHVGQRASFVLVVLEVLDETVSL